MTRKYTRRIEAVTENLGQEKVMDQSEMGINTPVEQATANDVIPKSLELEKFMNDELVIVVHPSSVEGALDFAPPQVNGINQPILRGIKSKVKRKYVEALARCRTTKYSQKITDPSRPDSIKTIPQTTLDFPFDVIHDPSNRGREWLDNILAQP